MYGSAILFAMEANPRDVGCVFACQAADRSGLLQILRSEFFLHLEPVYPGRVCIMSHPDIHLNAIRHRYDLA
jgi:hypothetical protein